mmetsp:Transcript_51027/g.146503  ORF Transcript_51027/g.146503 Transcript_51027/m.146503 type:complete len:261 (+) Transcript_51027:231-1013(+)
MVSHECVVVSGFRRLIRELDPLLESGDENLCFFLFVDLEALGKIIHVVVDAVQPPQEPLRVLPLLLLHFVALELVGPLLPSLQRLPDALLLADPVGEVGLVAFSCARGSCANEICRASQCNQASPRKVNAELGLPGVLPRMRAPRYPHAPLDPQSEHSCSDHRCNCHGPPRGRVGCGLPEATARQLSLPACDRGRACSARGNETVCGSAAEAEGQHRRHNQGGDAAWCRMPGRNISTPRLHPQSGMARASAPRMQICKMA